MLRKVTERWEAAKVIVRAPLDAVGVGQYSTKADKTMASKPTKSRRAGGRAGGRSGGAGYHFQDLYVALQLAKLLVASGRTPPVEVMWEKQAVDWGREEGTRPLAITDVLVSFRDGRTVHTQVKETAPGGRWSTAELLRSEIVKGFWEEWQAKTPVGRLSTKLRLASAGDVTPIRQIADVARRCRTFQEVFTKEAPEEISTDIRAIATTLQAEQQQDDLLEFLKSIDGEQLPAAEALRGWVSQSLAAFGVDADDLGQHLVDLVAGSKHLGGGARSAYRRESLVEDLRERGVDDSLLVGVGALLAPPFGEQTIWDRYRTSIVSSLGSLRLYGVSGDNPLSADLAQVYVPLRFLPVSKAPSTSGEEDVAERSELPIRRITAQALTGERPAEDDFSKGVAAPAWRTLQEILSGNRRVAFIGGPGTGKTTTLRWLALICAMSGNEGRLLRVANGLPAEPLRPMYVRFRELADRILARNLQGVTWRASLVTDFIAAQLEAGLLDSAPTRREALSIAQALLDSSQTVLLFDGLDEVADGATRDRLLDAVIDLLKAAPELRVISSWRPHALRRDLTTLDLQVFQPLPLNRVERRSFAYHWYAALRPMPAGFSDEDALRARAEDLSRAAERLSELAEVPLLYTIVALVHLGGSGLPVQRSVLYERATRAMLGHWEQDKTGRALDPKNVEQRGLNDILLTEDPLRRVVSYLAYVAQCEEKRAEISTGLAQSVLCSALSKEPIFTPERVNLAAQALVESLLERYGLLQERAPGVLAFAHLTFQEYMAARWLISQADFGIEQLARLAEDDRQAEVVRFAVAILAEAKEEQAQRAASALLQRFVARNAVLAASCLWESPSLRLPGDQAEEVARELWFALTDFRHHQVDPEVFARLFWKALSLTHRADRLFLEVLSSSGSERRNPMGGEGQLIVFGTRPAGKLSIDLLWYMQRIATVEHARENFRFRDLAILFLVESGVEPAEDCVPSLVKLFDRDRWWHTSIEDGSRPDLRAERLIRNLLEKSESRPRTLETLRALACLDGTERRARRRLIQVLLDTGEPFTESLADALVDGYLFYKWEQDKGIQRLKEFATRLGYREVLIESARRGLASEDRDKRKGCLRLLQEFGLVLSEGAPFEQTGGGTKGLADLHALAGGPSLEREGLDNLAECLWDEDRDIAWQAAKALVDAGQTDIPGLPHALVNVGLGSEATRPFATEILERLWSYPSMSLAVRASLLEGIRSASGPVASAAALLLMNHSEATTQARAYSITVAALKDPAQLREALPLLEALLVDESTCSATLRAFGEYFGGDAKKQVSAALAVRLAELGHLDCPGLPRALVFSALADGFQHDAAIAYLRQMLDDARFVTVARQALASGLKSDNRPVAWGATRCLWEVGSRTDPELPGALIEAGLAHEGTRDTAHLWLLELLSNARTAKRVREALDSKAETFRWADEYRKNYDLAWELARCALAARFFELEHFSELLVWGGFYRRERHELAQQTIVDLCNVEPWLENDIRDALLSGLGLKDREVSWGAAKIFFGSWSRENPPKLPRLLLNEGEVTLRDQVAALVKVALRERQVDPEAEAFLIKIRDDEPESARRLALAKLLEERQGPTAYQAARFLLEIGRLEEPALAVALVSVGLRSEDSFEHASALLDQLRQRPDVRARIWEALNRALWGEDEDAALGAARYLIERGEATNPGVARALVFGGLRHGSWINVEARRHTLGLLRRPESRENVILALEAFLGSNHPVENFEITSLLLQSGGALSTTMLKGLEGMVRRHPESVLAVLTLSRQGSAVLHEAKRLGLDSLVKVIGDAPFPSATSDEGH